MNSRIIFIAVMCGYVIVSTNAENDNRVYAIDEEQHQLRELGLGAGDHVAAVETDQSSVPHDRTKRTLFLKKKILGAGLLGFGLGAIKGYKAGYRSAPEVHHVYVAPPPVRYVEYVDKPVYIEKIVERPVFQAAPEYEAPRWSPSDFSSSHGSSSSSSSSNGYW